MMTASLQVLKGAPPGEVQLGQDRTVLGRNPDCQVVIPASSASREHAHILRVNGHYFVEDLQSRNHTYVNNEEVTQRRLLNDGDKIRICDFQATFRDARKPLSEAPGEEDDAEESPAEESEKVFIWSPPPPIDEPPEERKAAATGDIRLLMSDEAGLGSVLAECRRLWDALQENHVWVAYPRTRYQEVCEAVLTRSSEGCQLLAQGFYRLVVFDAAAGLTLEEPRVFDLHQFLEYALATVLASFELPLATGDCEAEDIAQILKDEPRSLFCFYNVQCVPARSLVRIRNFTQELHQVLLLALAREPDNPVEKPARKELDQKYAEAHCRYKVQGIDEATGKPRSLVLEAESAGEAMAQARHEGLRPRTVAATTPCKEGANERA
jgi:hypothetical protein